MQAPLARRLTPDVVATVFPGADGIGPVSGDPPVAPALRNGKVVGYLFSTFETADARGYAGEPFDVIVGLDLEGRIAGARLLEEHEPIIGPGLIPAQRLNAYFEHLRRLDIARPMRKRGRGVDGVSGATITAMLMHSGILTSARTVARRKGIVDGTGERRLALDLDSFTSLDWPALRDIGAVACAHAPGGRTGAVELCAALATPAGIGRNLFSGQWYGHHLSLLGLGDQLLWVGSRGGFPWKGARYRREGGFDRLRLSQGGRRIALRAGDTIAATALRVAGAPAFDEVGLLRLRRSSGFDPLRRWRLELAPAEPDVARGAGTLALDYRIPAGFVIGSDAELEAAGLKAPHYVLLGLVRESALTDWQRRWLAKAGEIAALLLLLSALTAILLFQKALVRRRRLHLLLRVAFLAVVLVWLGWIAGAQLTIINLLAYGQALFAGGAGGAFLYEPLILIIAVYTAGSLLLLGRGVFCGWLCPFGALQELLGRLARWVRLPQLMLPFRLNKRLWAIKYAAALLLVAAALWSMESATALAEIEPFKTVITLKFQRAWPFGLYAALLLAAGLFVERFFCRFLCPLGAALAILGRLHLANWLERRPQCGAPCHICERSCPVQAIAPSGRIDMNECLRCLDCQVDYYDDRRCPPLVARRKRRERRAAARPAAVADLGAAGASRAI